MQPRLVRLMMTAAILLAAWTTTFAQASGIAPPPSIVKDVGSTAGDSREKSLLTLESILDQFPTPVFLEAAGEQAEPTSPSPGALKAYIEGRAAFLANQRSSLELLEQAKRLDPRSAAILRLLGIANFTFGNTVRGTLYLRESLSIEPDDAESLFLLGRSAIERREPEEAIVLLSRSAKANEQSMDPAIRILRPYYLGQLLVQKGYDAAGVMVLDQFLAESESTPRVSRLYMEATRLDRHYGRILLEIGDAYCRLGRLEEAAQRYESAAEDAYVETQALITRRVYAALATGNEEQAIQLAVHYLRESTDASSALPLVAYVTQHSRQPALIAEQLKRYYAESNKPGSIALAIADALPPDQSTPFLRQHILENPQDLVALEGHLERLRKTAPERLPAETLDLLSSNSDSARDVMVRLLKVEPDANKLMNDLARITPASQQRAAYHYMLGVLHQELGHEALATSSYEKAIATDPSYLSPQLATVELQMLLGHNDRALELLEQLPAKDSDKITVLRATLLSLNEKHDEARRLIDELLASQPRNIEHRNVLARLLHRAGQYEEAERLLWATHDLDTLNEATFSQLFALYSDDNNPRADANQRQRLLRRAQETIPNSRLTRMRTALFEAERGRFPQTEAILRQMLASDPADPDAMRLLAELYELTNRSQDSVSLLLEATKARPTDSNPPRILLRSLTRSPKLIEPYLPRISQELEPLPLTMPLVLLRSEAYNRQNLYDRSLALFDLAIAQLPAHAADLYFYRSITNQHREDEASAENDLLKVLELEPDNDRACNALGYMWADKGKNLDRAEQLIHKALDVDPASVAYRDSLGWVYYKKGDFQLALEHLRKARAGEDGDDAVIVDHLGDALWRVGQKQEAIQQWKAAWETINKPEARDDSETRRTKQALSEKLKAVSGNQEPPLAPVAAP